MHDLEVKVVASSSQSIGQRLPGSRSAFAGNSIGGGWIRRRGEGVRVPVDLDLVASEQSSRGPFYLREQLPIGVNAESNDYMKKKGENGRVSAFVIIHDCDEGMQRRLVTFKKLLDRLHGAKRGELADSKLSDWLTSILGIDVYEEFARVI